MVFFGMPCGFSGPPLAALVAGGIDVAAVVLPAPNGIGRAWSPRSAVHQAPTLELRPVASPPNTAPPLIGEIARAAGLPILPVSSLRDARMLDTLQELRPDAIVVACFPMKLPRALLDLSPLGVLNLHPSLLPCDRGPDPLFWTFHRGARETGVTVHLMTERFDAGPILRQEWVAIPLGIDRDDLETELATIGGALLPDALQARAAGDAAGTGQDDRNATYAGFPQPADYQIDPAAWTAERAFRFARGIHGVSVRWSNGSVTQMAEVLDWGLGEPPSNVVIATSQPRLIRLVDGWLRSGADHKT